MAILVFSMVDVQAVVDNLALCTSYGPSREDLFNPELHKTGVLLDSKGRTEKEATKAGDFFWPSYENILQEKIQPQLNIVGDHGIYLMGNGRKEGDAGGTKAIAYAKGCDPSKDANFYENKVRLFGGDDGVVSIPTRWFELAKEKNVKEFKVKLNKRSIALVL